ncbi:uncharacterized protein LOC114273766 [Camellia sinensis]|uniref:uncharacterized protein LOC114273766 n=1 Tax=Camellia sinensis TaxID=4442 RepID=UPI0010361DDE|nr:uncharacterized protein LOC114273766 [Camellia sinensis]
MYLEEASEFLVCSLMKIFSWNCRGLGRREKRGKIRRLIVDRKIDIVLLQETKLNSCNNLDVKALWPKDKMEFLCVDSEGSSGGLLCIWDPGWVGERSFGIFWGLKSVFPKPWCIGGDFNEIISIGERIGCSMRDRGMRDFNNFIESCELSDIPLLGRKFTWCNAHEGEKWSKIDRFLVNPEWLEVFNFKLWGLPRLLSDHCPLILMEDDRDWGPRSFRFINAWILHPQFSGFLEKIWMEAIWNREVYGDVPTKLKSVEEELHKLDLLAEIRDLEEIEKARRKEVLSEAWKLSRRVEWMWLQKARLDWALKGDKNTRFFHIMATSRQSRNGLNPVTVGDMVYEDPVKVNQRNGNADHH